MTPAKGDTAEGPVRARRVSGIWQNMSYTPAHYMSRGAIDQQKKAFPVASIDATFLLFKTAFQI